MVRAFLRARLRRHPKDSTWRTVAAQRNAEHLARNGRQATVIYSQDEGGGAIAVLQIIAGTRDQRRREA